MEAATLEGVTEQAGRHLKTLITQTEPGVSLFPPEYACKLPEVESRKPTRNCLAML